MTKAANIRDAYDINTGERLPQPRGFRLQTVVFQQSATRMVESRKEYYVRLGYRAAQCRGEAHSNAHIDHCSVCLRDTWGVVTRKVDSGATDIKR